MYIKSYAFVNNDNFITEIAPEENLENLLGYTALQGSGIIITIQDAEVNSNVLNISDYLVHDPGDVHNYYVHLRI